NAVRPAELRTGTPRPRKCSLGPVPGAFCPLSATVRIGTTPSTACPVFNSTRETSTIHKTVLDLFIDYAPAITYLRTGTQCRESIKQDYHRCPATQPLDACCPGSKRRAKN